jgi:hypothetical protein
MARLGERAIQFLWQQRALPEQYLADLLLLGHAELSPRRIMARSKRHGPRKLHDRARY